VSRAEPVRALSALHAPGALAHEHLLSHPFAWPGIPSLVPGCHGLLRCRPPRLHTIHKPKAPSAGRSLHSAPRLRAQLGSRAATGTPTLPPRAQLPACFHARLRRTLGPSPVPAFAGAPEPHAAYRLLQQSAPRTHLRAAQTPSLDAAASCCAPGGDAPCGAPPTELPQARGLSGLSALSTPTPTTARQSGFTPT
jgi:hypothetical protein